MEQQTRTKIKFADDLIVPVLNSTKEATIRYDGFESVEVGETLIATTTEGEPFAELTVKRTTSVLAVEAHSVLQIFGANYPSTCPQDIIDSLNEYYDDGIAPSTTVEILVFELVTRLDVDC